MKVNKEFSQMNIHTEVEERWTQIISLLKGAEDAGKWAFWRERFKCTHPDHNPEEIDNPTQFATVTFHAAKYIYCIHKTEMDKFADDLYEGKIFSYPYKTEHCELFYAMKRVVEEEMTEQLENQVLSEEGVLGYWEGDEFLPLPDPNVELDLDSY